LVLKLSAYIFGLHNSTASGAGHNHEGTLIPANFSLAGFVTGDSINVMQPAGLYNSANVPTVNTVTASLALGNFTGAAGTLLTNYALPTTASGVGQITAVMLTGVQSFSP